jgi:hypothetical protein
MASFNMANFSDGSRRFVLHRHKLPDRFALNTGAMK